MNQIETVDVDSIHLDPGNLRKRTARNLAAIKASLKRFGQQRPILVDADNIVRAGNGTLLAARQLGWKTIEITRTALKGAEAVAYAIADNRSAELAEWEQTGLAETLRSLQSEDFDLADVGFSDDEVDQICEKLATELAGPLDPEPTGGGEVGKATGPAAVPGADPEPPPVSHVRMVQLFLTTDTVVEFDRMVSSLMERYQTANATDTVMESLKRETDLREQEAA
jgi:hypothetical protein